tara:strand:- start:741 stop:893 length:153 start_codon:yes stop_codon:yes gene_type:complete
MNFDMSFDKVFKDEDWKGGPDYEKNEALEPEIIEPEDNREWVEHGSGGGA